MVNEFTASKEAAGEQAEKQPENSGWDALSARLSVENQGGHQIAFKSELVLVHLQLCSTDSDDPNREPCFELPYAVKPAQAVLMHKGDLSDDGEKLSSGGTISKNGDKIELQFPNDDAVVLNPKTGEVDVDSQEKYQREVHFEGTPWQRTIITSNNDTRITFGADSINSVERNGVMELFPHSYSKELGSEPRLPATEELQRKLNNHDEGELSEAFARIDKTEGLAHERVRKSNSDSASVEALAETIKERGLLLEKAAEVLPADAERLEAIAESQLRLALQNMRDKFGPGTSETKEFTDALKDLLQTKHNSDQNEEVDRLGFESRRGGHMKNVVENIEESPGASYQTMDRDRSVTIRKSLISIHIASGDNGLKSFVGDVNKRLDASTLIAPIGQDGPFHHGAIILTDEGATTYNGSFNLLKK